MATTENDVKNAHMVSAGYIRAWADKRNVVDVLDLQEGRGYPVSYKSATVVNYVYDPNLLARNLEGDYSDIENAGTPALVKMRNGEPLTEAEAHAVIAFLDMHLDRGRYADRTKVRAPAVALTKDGRILQTELALGDALLLSQSFQDVLRLSSLGLEHWPWHVREEKGLATGDGAVLLWRTTDGAEVSTISFPLSPTQLLVIGEDLPDNVPLNPLLAQNSKRWIVGTRGSLDFSKAAVIAARRSRE
uniref:DUF4238 domain-containing protein n=1 Tax=Arthrobacter sp. Chr15 TaxID=447032 RepID=A6YFP2_9MICC|nr:DUF4238 domain-containing protein [Arthrobacter sp. Chr15]ABR67053.1 unknown [Arthrobacter sp. Chr15]